MAAGKWRISSLFLIREYIFKTASNKDSEICGAFSDFEEIQYFISFLISFRYSKFYTFKFDLALC